MMDFWELSHYTTDEIEQAQKAARQRVLDFVSQQDGAWELAATCEQELLRRHMGRLHIKKGDKVIIDYIDGAEKAVYEGIHRPNHTRSYPKLQFRGVTKKKKPRKTVELVSYKHISMIKRQPHD